MEVFLKTGLQSILFLMQCRRRPELANECLRQTKLALQTDLETLSC